MNIGEMLRGLLYTSEQATPAEAAAPHAASADHDDGDKPNMAFRELTERLWKMLGEQRTVLSGNIHLIGMQRIREKVGDDWPRIADRAMDVANKCIARACGPDDVFLTYDELSFLIIFANLSKEQAQLRCMEIVEDITRRLLGEGASPETAEVSTGVFETDGTLIFNAISKNDLIARVTGQIGEEAETPPAPLEAEDATLEAEIDDSLPDYSPFHIDQQKALASIRVLYQPMWNLRHKAIVSYFATATARNVFSVNLWDDMVRRNFSHVLSSVEVDIFVAHIAMRDFAKRIAQGPRLLIGWPVHFETLASRNYRNLFIEFCRDIPEEVRKLLILELDGLPEGVPNSRVLEIISVLRPFCRVVNVRVAPEFKRFEVFSGSQIGGVGFSLSGLPLRDSQRISMMDRFVGDATRVGLRCYVHGLNTRAQALAAATAGFEWVNGAAVGEPSNDLGQMRRFQIADLYNDLSAS